MTRSRASLYGVKPQADNTRSGARRAPTLRSVIVIIRSAVQRPACKVAGERNRCVPATISKPRRYVLRVLSLSLSLTRGVAPRRTGHAGRHDSRGRCGTIRSSRPAGPAQRGRRWPLRSPRPRSTLAIGRRAPAMKLSYEYVKRVSSGVRVACLTDRRQACHQSAAAGRRRAAHATCMRRCGLALWRQPLRLRRSL